MTQQSANLWMPNGTYMTIIDHYMFESHPHNKPVIKPMVAKLHRGPSVLSSSLNICSSPKALYWPRLSCYRADSSVEPSPLHHRMLNINVNVCKTQRCTENVNEAHTKG